MSPLAEDTDVVMGADCKNTCEVVGVKRRLEEDPNLSSKRLSNYRTILNLHNSDCWDEKKDAVIADTPKRVCTVRKKRFSGARKLMVQDVHKATMKHAIEGRQYIHRRSPSMTLPMVIRGQPVWQRVVPHIKRNNRITW